MRIDEFLDGSKIDGVILCPKMIAMDEKDATGQRKQQCGAYQDAPKHLSLAFRPAEDSYLGGRHYMHRAVTYGHQQANLASVATLRAILGSHS